MKPVDSQMFASRLKIILLSHKIKDYMSEESLNGMLDNLIPTAYADGFFDLTYLDIYLSREYKVPTDKVAQILQDIQSIQDKLEIRTIRTGATSIPKAPAPPKIFNSSVAPPMPLPPLPVKPQQTGATPPSSPSPTPPIKKNAAAPKSPKAAASAPEPKKMWKCPRCGTIQSRSPVCPSCELNIEGFASLQDSYRKREAAMSSADFQPKSDFFSPKNIGGLVIATLLTVLVAYKIMTYYYGSENTPGAKPPPLSSLSAEPVSESEIILAWSCKSCKQSEFAIERKGGADDSYARVESAKANHNEFKDAGLEEGSDYCYRIRFNAYAKHYNVACVSTYPAQPTNVEVKTDLGSGIVVSWTDNSANEGGYVLERKVGAEKKYEKIAELSADETSYSDTNVIEGTNYCYRVGIYKASPAYLIYSNNACVESAKSKPDAPSGVKAVISQDQTIYISWSDNSDNEDGFIIERRTPYDGTFRRIKSVGPNEIQTTDIGYPSGMDYSYRVKAFNSGGESGYSGETKVIAPRVYRNPWEGGEGGGEYSGEDRVYQEREEAYRCANRCVGRCRGRTSCVESCVYRCMR